MVYILFVCLQKQTNTTMKRKQFLLFAAFGLFAASCSTTDAETDESNEEVAVIEYELDTENSSLQWTGRHGDDSHIGTVSFSEGALSMKLDKLESGSFVVDMTSIIEPGGQGLVEHLMGLDDNEYHKPEDFFHTTKFPTVEVSLGEYNDGTLSAELNILGQTMPIDVEVDLKNEDSKASISGSFTVNFEDLGIPGFQKDPESGDGISPAVEFELDLALKAK